ncbi:Fn3-like domain-containing protein [Mycena venus]|uniref:beta-glucosidase n=1 Tax=Mycena venus TaxID=2733690 RepID=A0A8H6YIR8_9AGAR|nr:Fn3-like domain-containing protein [Mycena venus]
MDFPCHNARSAGRWHGTLGQRSRRKKFISGLTLEEKIKVTARIDVGGLYVGNTGVHRSCFFPDCVQWETNDPHLNWNGLCLQDSPLCVHLAHLIEARGKAMGAKFHGKGVNVALRPPDGAALYFLSACTEEACIVGQQATAGRNGAGFGAGPFPCCMVTAATINGIQSNGLIATIKHLRGCMRSPDLPGLDTSVGLPVFIAALRPLF